MKRKRFLIYPRFQLTLIAFQWVILGAILISIYFSIGNAVTHLRSTAVEVGLDPSHPFFRLIALEEKLLIKSLQWPFALAAIAITVLTVWVSDRLAGPIIRLREFFREAGTSGKAGEVRFRKGDFFDDLPEVINDALKRITK
ncbi:MAG: hypothetical protein JNL01_12995 [Bdellovibrionales bacterium]|nr:hypothetical protein [Bdellovibrionales bacterium]